jgi:intracellular septation protein
VLKTPPESPLEAPLASKSTTRSRGQALLPIVASLLPVLVFTAIEELYGTKAGLIAGVVFCIGEVAYEFKKFGRPQTITLVANALVLILGGVSLFESNAVFFKLQPALMVFMMAGALLISSVLKKPFLVELAKKQRPDLPEFALSRMAGLNLRMGICLIAIALLGVYAAFEWSTAWWAAYKAVGAPVLLILYVLIDLAILKRRGRS